jgi:hypothetical protein
MDIRNIPIDKQIIITTGSQNVFEALRGEIPSLRVPKLIFNEQVSLNFSSKYGDLAQAQGSNLLTLLSGFTGGKVPSGQFGIQSLQVWQGTEPLSFSLDVELHMVDSGKHDVLIPALALTKLCLPSYKGSGDKRGMALIPPGPDLGYILQTVIQSSMVLSELFNDGQSIKSPSNGGGIVSIQFGRMFTLQNVLLTKIQPTFSILKDEEGMPVNCKLSMEFTTMEVATTAMVQGMITGISRLTGTSVSSSTVSSAPISNLVM